MKKFRKIFAAAASMALAVTAFSAPVLAQTVDTTYNCSLSARVTDAGEVVNKMTIDFGAGNRVSNVDVDTFTVTAKSTIKIEDEDYKGKVQYDGERKIVKVETDGQYVNVYFDENDGYGSTLTYISDAEKGYARNYPGELEYTIVQNKGVTLTAADGREIDNDYIAKYTTDNTVTNDETAKFESVIVENGINYQYYDAGDADSLIVWFHGNGEGDLLNSGNNVAQMLANRGTVAWASDEAQEIFGGAHVMSFQAPDTWYYAQRDGLLEIAYNEINDLIKAKNIDPEKVYVSGCSAGGYMTTRMLIAYPDLFKAAMINCPALDVATIRGGQTPTDEELASLTKSDTAIWLVQGVTDSSVATDECSKRMFKILIEGQETTEIRYLQNINSDFTTYETKDNKYKLTLYDTVNVDGANKINLEEDYDMDGIPTLVHYNDHWTWIFTLNNNPKDASGTSIMEWAANYNVDAEQPATPVAPSPDSPEKAVPTGDNVLTSLYATAALLSVCGLAFVKRKFN